MAFKMKAGPEGPMVKNFGSALKHSNKDNKHPGGDPEHDKHEEGGIANFGKRIVEAWTKKIPEMIGYFGDRHIKRKQSVTPNEDTQKITS